MVIKNIFLIIVALLGTSCVWSGPSPLFMSTDVPGTPEFKRGWEDGCQSGIAAYGTAIQKMFYNFYQDYRMLHNPHYNAAWHEAFDYCRHYNAKWQTHDFYTGGMD